MPDWNTVHAVDVRRHFNNGEEGIGDVAEMGAWDRVRIELARLETQLENQKLMQIRASQQATTLMEVITEIVRTIGLAD